MGKSEWNWFRRRTGWNTNLVRMMIAERWMFDELLVLMTLSSFMYPMKEAPAKLYPAGPVFLPMVFPRRNVHKLSCESPFRGRYRRNNR